MLGLFRAAVRLIFKAVFRVRVEGLENVPPAPAVICSNHLGWADTFLVMLFLPLEPRIYVLAEKQVKDISVVRSWLIEQLGAMVPLDRQKPREALRVMESRLRGGGSLLVFPEGKLGTEEGVIGPLQPGAAHISYLAGVPLLPVGVTGTRALWLRRTLTLRIGKPIEPTLYAGSLRMHLDATTEQLSKSMRALLPGDDTPHSVRPLEKWLTSLF